MAKERISEFKYESGSNSITITAYEGRCIEFEIDAPWYGSTEQGFGATLQLTVPWEEASPMVEKLFLFVAAAKRSDDDEQ